LDNNSEKPFTITIGDRIAQLVLYNIQTPKVHEVAAVPDTTRGEKGFGSTGLSSLSPPPNPMPSEQHAPESPCVRTTATEETIKKPFDIYCSHDPFDNTLEIEIAVKGDHPTLGIISQQCPF
jgi:hypothetical protein